MDSDILCVALEGRYGFQIWVLSLAFGLIPGHFDRMDAFAGV